MTDTTKQQLKITLMAEWGAGPLWVKVGNDVADPYDTEEIAELVALSPGLRAAIAAWDERYQSTFNEAVPQESGIRDPDKRVAFIADGRVLAKLISAEVRSGVVVEYASLSGEVWRVEREH